MAKDRARPFSRKHRRYWIPVTGGMIVIGVVNVVIGFTVWHCSDAEPSGPPQRIHLNIPPPRDAAIDGPGTIGAGKLPAEVMRAFAIKYPRLIPKGARAVGDGYEIAFPPGAGHAHATFRADGTFVSDD